MRLLLAIVLLTPLIDGCRKPAGTPRKLPADTVQAVEGGAGTESRRDSGQGRTHEVTQAGDVQKIPAGFPLPLMPGAEVMRSSRLTQMDGTVLFMVDFRAPGTIKEIADYYEKAMRDRGLKVERSDQGTIVRMPGRKDYDMPGENLRSESKRIEVWVGISLAENEVQPTATISWTMKRK